MNTDIQQLQELTSKLLDKDVALKKSEEQLRRIINNMFDSLSEVDSEGKYVYVAPSYTTIFGYSYEEAIGKSALSLVHPDDVDKLLTIYSNAISNKSDSMSCEARMRHKNGHYIIIEARIRAIKDENGEISGAILSARDITEKRRMEKLLKHQDEIHKIIIKNIKEAIIITDLNNIITYASPSTAINFYISMEDLIGKNIFDFIYKSDLEKAQYSLSNVMNDGSDVSIFRVVNGHHNPFYVRVSSVIHEDNGNSVIIRVISDINDSKRYELELQKSEAQYRMLVEDQTELICRILPDGMITFVNGAFCRYFEARKEMFIGADVRELIVEEDKERVVKEFEQLTQSNPIKIIRFRIKMHNHIRWQEWSCRLLFDRKDQPFIVQASGRDITEQIKMEEITNKRCNTLQTISENLEAMVWIKNLEGRYMFASKMLCERILMTTPENALGKTDAELLINGCSSLESITDEITINEKSSTRFYIIYDCDDQQVWLDVKKTPLYTMGKVLTGTVGVAFDITKDGEDIKKGLNIRLSKELIKEVVPDKVYQLKRV